MENKSNIKRSKLYLVTRFLYLCLLQQKKLCAIFFFVVILGGITRVYCDQALLDALGSVSGLLQDAMHKSKTQNLNHKEVCSLPLSKFYALSIKDNIDPCEYERLEIKKSFDKVFTDSIAIMLRVLGLMLISWLHKTAYYKVYCKFAPYFYAKTKAKISDKIRRKKYNFFVKYSRSEISDRYDMLFSGMEDVLQHIFDFIEKVSSITCNIFSIFGAIKKVDLETGVKNGVCGSLFIICLFTGISLHKTFRKISNLSTESALHSARLNSFFGDQLLNINALHAFGEYENEKRKFDKKANELKIADRKFKQKCATVKFISLLGRHAVSILLLIMLYIPLKSLHERLSIKDNIDITKFKDELNKTSNVIRSFITLAQRLSMLWGDFYELMLDLGTTIEEVQKLQLCIEFLFINPADQAEEQNTAHLDKYGELNILAKQFKAKDISLCNGKCNFVPKEIDNLDVNIENISFSYGSTIDKGKNFFNFNLNIPFNQKLGIVGKSGSGKSTLMNLILGLYTLVDGDIRIGKYSIRELNRCCWRKLIAYIPQQPILLDRTIQENITYTDHSMLTSTEYKRMVQAAEKAYAYDFINSLEEGFDFNVGSMGERLSGGQRQRIAIARAFYRQYSYLILEDEATSALDALTERYVIDSMENLYKSKTAISIAHKPKTLEKMDRVIYIDNYQVIQEGIHEELINTNGMYRDLFLGTSNAE